MIRIRPVFFLALCIMLLPIPAGALTLKIGSLAPSSSPWDKALRRIAAEWIKLSGGSLEVKIYSAGVAGDEPDIVRKVRIGQISGAMITMNGLQGIYNGIKALSFPLFIRDDGELSGVLGKLEPIFEKELEKRGFKVIFWSTGGWLYFFSRYPITTPDDLRKQNLWVWGNPDEVQAWQSSGFQVVPLAATDILTSLQSGMIDATISSPLLAASNQWFGAASNMTDLKLAPLWGATIVSLKTWSAIPADLQGKLLRSAQKIAATLSPEISRSDSDAIGIMQKYGLTIVKVDPKARKAWEDLVEKGFGMLVGTAYDAQSYQMVKDVLDEYRRSRADP